MWYAGSFSRLPGERVRELGRGAGLLFFAVFVRMLSEITRQEVVGFQGVVYTFRVFVISTWMNVSDIRHLDIIVWLDVPGPLRSAARFLFAIILKVLRVEGFRHFHTLSKNFDKMFEKFGKSLIFVLSMNKYINRY